jgi:hypothetical protein
LASSLAALPAHAEDKARSEVDRIIDRGVELRESGKDAAALEEFRRAYELSHGGRALAQLALAEQALGQWIDAESHLKVALDSTTDRWVRANRQALEGALRAIQQRLGNLDLTVNVAGAQLRLNGADVGRMPLGQPARVVAGTVIVDLSADGYWPVQRSVLVPAGGVARESVLMARHEEQGGARSTVGATPSSGPPARTAEPMSAPPPPASGSAALISSPPAVELRTEPRSRWWLWVTAGAAVAGVGGGVAGLAIGEDHIQKYNSNACLSFNATRIQNCGGDLDTANTARGVATASFIGAGALLATTAVLWLLAD